MATKQNHQTASNSKRRSNHGTIILIDAQKDKSQKKARKKTEKLVNKTKSHDNNSRSKSKRQNSSSTKNGKIKPKKNEKEIREDTSTYWDVLYTKTRKMYQAYYSLMNYYANPFFQYPYQKPASSLTA